MPEDLVDGKWTLVQVMAWCHQAPRHYLNQCWPGSKMPYNVIRPHWGNGWSNSLYVKLLCGNMNMYLDFISFIDTEVAQIITICALKNEGYAVLNCHGCWPGNARSQGISSYCIGLVNSHAMYVGLVTQGARASAAMVLAWSTAMPCMLAWWHKEPGHQQLWYWPGQQPCHVCWPGDTRSQGISSYGIGLVNSHAMSVDLVTQGARASAAMVLAWFTAMSCLLAWWHKEPGHQQLWYWPGSQPCHACWPGDTRSQGISSYYIGLVNSHHIWSHTGIGSFVYILWHDHSIWHHGSASTLVQVVAHCLMASS